MLLQQIIYVVFLHIFTRIQLIYRELLLAATPMMMLYISYFINGPNQGLLTFAKPALIITLPASVFSSVKLYFL